MQAIIMAAGFGSRISKITDGKPKSFLKINNETLIERSVRLLTERGITDITVVTGYEGDLIRQLLPVEIKTLHNPLYFCTNVLASFSIGMKNLKDDFIFLHADTIFDERILDELIAPKDFDLVLPVDFKQCVDEDMKVVTADGLLVKISKLIPLDKAEGEFIGIARVSKDILEELKESVSYELKEKRNLQEYFEAAIQRLVDRGKSVECMPTKQYPWKEIDFPEDYEMALKLFEKTDS